MFSFISACAANQSTGQRGPSLVPTAVLGNTVLEMSHVARYSRLDDEESVVKCPEPKRALLSKASGTKCGWTGCLLVGRPARAVDLLSLITLLVPAKRVIPVTRDIQEDAYSA